MRQIVYALGASISVASVPDQGSRFRIELPLEASGGRQADQHPPGR